MKTLSLILTLAFEMQTVPRPLPRDLAAVAVERTAESPAVAPTDSALGGAAPGQIPAIQLEQNNRTQEQERNVTTRDADLRDLLTSLAQSASLNLSMGPDVSGKVTIDLEDASLGEALDAILTPLNLQFRIDGKLLRVFRPLLESRTLTFDYVNTTRSMSRSLAASASAGFAGGGVAGGLAGGGTAGGSSTSISGSESTDVMRDIGAALELIKSPLGKVVPMKMAGMFFATDTPKSLDAMQLFLETVQNSVNRQIVIEAKLIEVQLNDQNQAGVNWNAALGNTLTLTSTMAQASSFQLGITHKSFNALLSALRTQGTVDVRSAPSISTLNNQPAVIRIGTQDVFFVTTTQTDPRTGTIIQTATTPATVNEGVVLDVTPHISEDGVITMNVHPTITERTGAAVSPQGDSVPIVDVRETDTIVRVLDGDTVAIAGLISGKTLKNFTKVPLIGDLPLIGSLFKRSSVEKDKTDMVVLLTPRILTLKTAIEYTRERMEQQDQLNEDQQRVR